MGCYNSMNPKPTRILIVRNDRLGDLVLTTPMFEALKRGMPKSHLETLVSPGNLDLVKNNPFVDGILLDEYDHSLRGFLQLVRNIKKRSFDAAVMVVPSLRIALALAAARIPLRIGPATHLYCLALLNRPVVQHRSRVEKHEAEYNLDLLNVLGIVAPPDLRTHVRPLDEDAMWAREKMAQLGLGDKKLVVVHPCSLGSARNWKETQWAALLKYLQDDHRFLCVVTGGPGDRAAIDGILSRYGLAALSLAGQTTLGKLIALQSLADAFVASSTGPLHLAAAMDRCVFGIFPPIRVQSPKRWGPWRAKNSTLFTPEAACPATYHCKQEKCSLFDCMDNIHPGHLYREICKCLFPNAY